MVDPPDLDCFLAHRHDCLVGTSTASSLPSKDLSASSTTRHGHLSASPLSASVYALKSHHRNASTSRRVKTTSLSTLRTAALFAFILALFATCTYGHVLPHDASGNHVGRSADTERRAPGGVADTASMLEDRAVLNWYSPRSYPDTIQSSREAERFISRNDAPTQVVRRAAEPAASTCACGEKEVPVGRKVGFGILVPILVILSGIFAGLTLGYMSLDETQLQVLMTTGTPVQRARAAKILPIRQDGHLLLTTLLIANMITNETLPIIFDPLLSSSGAGGAVSVVISTVLIVIFSELIPQSTCSRYGLQIGAFMAMPTRIIILILYPIAWPVSRILHFVLGPHHGIVYRRAELKELVTMHAASGGRGGDLKGDTVMIVGGALDLQEKVVKQAMTPIDQVFMLPFSAKLDYPTLERVVRSGHSRIPIYQEVEVTAQKPKSGSATPRRKMSLLTSLSRKATMDSKDNSTQAAKGDVVRQDADGNDIIIRKKIIGTLLVKSCVLLDPEDAVPVSDMVINALPSVPWDEPLLNVLNAFQEGRSHMAIISSRSRRGMASESIADLGVKSNITHGQAKLPAASAAPRVDGLGHIDEEKQIDGTDYNGEGRRSRSTSTTSSTEGSRGSPHSKTKSSWRAKLGLFHGDDKEQNVPSDATIADSKAQEKATDPYELHKIDSRISVPQDTDDGVSLPLGIITLEDVLEELLGEEILDEYDDRGNEEQDFRNLIPPPSPDHDFKMQIAEHGILGTTTSPETVPKAADTSKAEQQSSSPPPADAPSNSTAASQTPAPTAKKTVLARFGLTGRQKGLADVDAPSSGSGEAVAPGSQDPNASADGVMHRPNKPEHIAMPSSLADSSDNGSQQRKSSLPPSSDAPQGVSSADDRAGWLQHFGSTTASPLPLPTPSVNRPVVLRTKGADGSEKTMLASESLLRGRTNLPTLQAGSMGGNTLPPTTSLGAAGATIGGSTGAQPLQQQQPASASRSQTPVGTRGSRFKSQAVAGAVPAAGAFVPRPLTTQQRSRSQGGEAPSSRLWQDGLTPGGSGEGDRSPAAAASSRLTSSAAPTRSSSPEPIRTDSTASVSGEPAAEANETPQQ